MLEPGILSGIHKIEGPIQMKLVKIICSSSVTLAGIIQQDKKSDGCIRVSAREFLLECLFNLKGPLSLADFICC